MLPGELFAAVDHHADVEAVVQQVLDEVRAEHSAGARTQPQAVQPCGDAAVAGARCTAGEQLAHNGGLGCGDPKRVDDGKLLCTRFDCGPVDVGKKEWIRPGAVDAKEAHGDVVGDGMFHCGHHPPHHGVPIHAVCRQLAVAQRRLDDRGVHAELEQLLDIGWHRPREAPDLGLQLRGHDQLIGFHIIVRHSREAGLDAVDAKAVEGDGDGELVVRGQHHTNGLLTVSQRCVVDPNLATLERAGIDGALVDVAGPDEGAIDHERKSSG